jgi:D-glycero-alpha-D-manno-heptose-7-phosphate kinase
MIISRTPFRISFFGGGTDYPEWYRENGGAILAVTIDKYCYISCRFLPPFFDHKTRLAYSHIECVRSNDQIKHPAVRATLKYLGMEEGVEIHHDGDLPARTGLGSSSAFTVGLLHGLYALQKKMLSRRQLALEAIRIERKILKEKGGVQDQFVIALGGFNKIVFSSYVEHSIQPMIVMRDRLAEFHSHLMLYYTGLSRSSSEIAREQIENIPQCKTALIRMTEMVDEAVSLLAGEGDFSEFGRLLHESWQLKKSFSSKVSPPLCDEIYQAARDAGALGGKLLGAGGGGFMLIFARPEDQPKIRERLKGLLSVPFHFETQGAQIIFYDSSAQERDGRDSTKNTAREPLVYAPSGPSS